jgi:hypothetical protein
MWTGKEGTRRNPPPPPARPPWQRKTCTIESDSSIVKATVPNSQKKQSVPSLAAAAFACAHRFEKSRPVRVLGTSLPFPPTYDHLLPPFPAKSTYSLSRPHATEGSAIAPAPHGSPDQDDRPKIEKGRHTHATGEEIRVQRGDREPEDRIRKRAKEEVLHGSYR